MQKIKLHPRFIDREAKQIVKRLQENSFESYLVGGCIRDLLVGIYPKDYDIATNARPAQVKKVVPYSYIIGKRFRLVLVKRGSRQFEVATFRRNITPEELAGFDEDELIGDNFYGTPEEDAKRRDFTINSMFYDPSSSQLIDHCNGLGDINAGMIRIIGEPNRRMQEDSIRILRALRLAHKIKFAIQTELKTAMQENGPLLAEAVLPRKREEYLKLLRLKNPAQAFTEAQDIDLIRHCLPSLTEIFEDPSMCEEFLTRLRQIPTAVSSEDSPLELFAQLVLSYLLAKFGDDLWQMTRKQLVDNEPLTKFMRDELGMFKSEQSMTLKAITTAARMSEVDKFVRRGARRKLAFISSDAFLLSLNLAKQEMLLSCQDYHFWHKEFKDFCNSPLSREMQSSSSKAKSKKKSKGSNRGGQKSGQRGSSKNFKKPSLKNDNKSSSENPQSAQKADDATTLSSAD